MKTQEIKKQTSISDYVICFNGIWCEIKAVYMGRVVISYNNTIVTLSSFIIKKNKSYRHKSSFYGINIETLNQYLEDERQSMLYLAKIRSELKSSLE